MDLWKIKEIKYFTYYILASIVLALLLIIINIPFFQTLQVCFGLIYVLFIPGYLATTIIFHKIDLIEKIALSFALSIAITTLTIIFTNNVLKIPFTGFTNFIIIAVIIFALLGIKYSMKNE